MNPSNLKLSFAIGCAVASFGLSGCAVVAGSKGVNWSKANPGPQPELEDAKVQAKEAILRNLKDPESAKFRDSTPIFKTLYNFGLASAGRAEPLWAICLEVNAKNSYGGYEGFKYWYVKFRNGKALHDSLAVGPGEYDCKNGPLDYSRTH